ncbi:hypothetical protein LXL04_033599 [Taraxacum kok-saghyz]
MDQKIDTGNPDQPYRTQPPRVLDRGHILAHLAVGNRGRYNYNRIIKGLCPSIINHLHSTRISPSFSLPLDLQFLSVCGCNFCPIYLSISNLSVSVPILSFPISRGSDLLCGSNLPNPSFYLSIDLLSCCNSNTLSTESEEVYVSLISTSSSYVYVYF